jgi:putative hemolysin
MKPFHLVPSKDQLPQGLLEIVPKWAALKKGHYKINPWCCSVKKVPRKSKARGAQKT